MAALEQQRSQDHVIIHDLGNAVIFLQSLVEQQSNGLESLTKSGLHLRQEIFAARADLTSGIAGAQDAAQNAAMAQMAVTVGSGTRR